MNIIKSYPIPVTILDGLDRAEEAIQFVVINYTQKKVEPDLVLRILHKRFRDRCEKLEFFLKRQTWRLYAVDICDQLNDDPKSPWFDKIIAPGESRKGKIIIEQNFINSLELVYPRLSPDIDIVKNYLPLYWRAIANVWPECTGDKASNYSMLRTNGIAAFHGMFPFIYFKSVSLGTASIKDFMKYLTPLRKNYGPDFWKRGGRAKMYSSKGAQRMLTDEMIANTLPGGKSFKLDKLHKNLEGTKEARTWAVAEKLIPLRSYSLFTPENVNKVAAGDATGIYILYSFSHQKYYTGRTEKANLKSRLQSHLQKKNENNMHIFNHHPCKDAKQAHDMECALYHLLPKHVLLNKEHPSALDDRKCPFCSA